MATQQILDLDKNEEVLQEIRRHPIGLIGIYGVGGLSVVTLLVLLFVLVSVDTPILNVSDVGYALIFGTLSVLMMLFTYIGVYVYNRNELVLTNENIIQVLQFSLFNRQVSQLNLTKIQDVSVDQAGLIQTFFKYGTIEIETAGEAANFRFPFAPNPNIAAKMIIEAHEDYVRRHNNGARSFDI